MVHRNGDEDGIHARTDITTVCANGIRKTAIKVSDAPSQSISMPRIGKIEEFDQKLESWSSYVERIEVFFAANDIEELKEPMFFSRL